MPFGTFIRPVRTLFISASSVFIVVAAVGLSFVIYVSTALSLGERTELS